MQATCPQHFDRKTITYPNRETSPDAYFGDLRFPAGRRAIDGNAKRLRADQRLQLAL